MKDNIKSSRMSKFDAFRSNRDQITHLKIHKTILTHIFLRLQIHKNRQTF